MENERENHEYNEELYNFLKEIKGKSKDKKNNIKRLAMLTYQHLKRFHYDRFKGNVIVELYKTQLPQATAYRFKMAVLNYLLAKGFISEERLKKPIFKFSRRILGSNAESYAEILKYGCRCVESKSVVRHLNNYSVSKIYELRR